jgi:hypothetical protein
MAVDGIHSLRSLLLVSDKTAGLLCESVVLCFAQSCSAVHKLAHLPAFHNSSFPRDIVVKKSDFLTSYLIELEGDFRCL